MKYLLTLIAVLCFHCLFAQIQVPDIKFDLYFEDAMGHLDTVTVGYDHDADANIDLDFGESNLRGLPFDPVFEVRGADMSGLEYQSNPTVQYYTDYFCEEWPLTQYQSVIIYAKHWPVTVRWDKTYFEENCYRWTHFTRIWSFLFHPEFVDGEVTHLYTNDSMVLEKSYLLQTNHYRNNRLEPLIGGGEDYVYVVWVGLGSVYPSAIPVTEVASKAVSVSPNPAGNVLHIASAGQSAIQGIAVRDLLGHTQVLQDWAVQGDQIELAVGTLAAGFYTGQIRYAGDKVEVFKFVKVE
jgi:hypothetical protein